MNRRERRARRKDDGDGGDRRAAHHKAWMQENIEAIMTAASAGYAGQGRGAVYADLDAAKGGPVTITYFSDEMVGSAPAAVAAAGTIHGWPDDTIARMVKTYNPKTHIVMVITQHGRQSAYRFHLMRTPA